MGAMGTQSWGPSAWRHIQKFLRFNKRLNLLIRISIQLNYFDDCYSVIYLDLFLHRLQEDHQIRGLYSRNSKFWSAIETSIETAITQTVHSSFIDLILWMKLIKKPHEIKTHLDSLFVQNISGNRFSVYCYLLESLCYPLCYQPLPCSRS